MSDTEQQAERNAIEGLGACVLSVMSFSAAQLRIISAASIRRIARLSGCLSIFIRPDSIREIFRMSSMRRFSLCACVWMMEQN